MSSNIARLLLEARCPVYPARIAKQSSVIAVASQMPAYRYSWRNASELDKIRRHGPNSWR
jgi:hypothetical protein